MEATRAGGADTSSKSSIGCASYRFARRCVDRRQQSDVAARFQPAIECRAEPMKRLQHRSEMAFDGAARSGHLVGDEVSAPCRAHQ